MPSPVWTLTIDSVTRTLAEWRVEGVVLQRRNLAADVLRFNAPRAAFDEDPLCDYGATLTLLRDAVPWFIGQREVVPAQAAAAGEAQGYTFRGVWRWLEDNVYQQYWYAGTIPTSHCILNGTVGANLRAVLDYAIANGAQLQYNLADLIALAPVPPVSEFTEKLCADAIIEQLHFAPDVVAWVDHSTTPTPTVRFRRRADLSAATVRLADHANDSVPAVESILLTPRPDLRVPSVKINGETIQTVDGDQFVIPSIDVYPHGSTGREDRAFNAVITLQGSTTVNVFGELDCETIDTDSLDWFKARVDALRDPRINVLRLVPGSVERVDEDGVAIPVGDQLPRELLPGGGQIADWMGFQFQRETFRFKVDLEFNETAGDGVPLVGLKDQLFAVELITTDAPAGHTTHSAIAEQQEGDPSILGLAQYLYDSLNPLHYEGGCTLLESECSGAIDLGTALNLLGSRAEYATMRAVIQEAAFEIDTGRTTVTFGPPRVLGISEILALLQRFRRRRRWTNPALQETGELSGQSTDVNLGRAVANTNTVPGQGVTSLLIVKDGGTTIKLDAASALVEIVQGQSAVRLDGASSRATLTNGINTILLDAAVGRVFINSVSASAGSIDLLLSDTGGQAIAIRPIGVCENGENKNARVVRGPTY